ncbi:MAG: hypothetical protein Roseis2KO_03180 [Roseivirga sp.]
MRNKVGIKRKSIEFHKAYSKEVKIFLSQLKMFLNTFKSDHKILKTRGSHYLSQGKYSLTSFPSFLNKAFSYYEKDLNQEVVSNLSAVELAPNSNRLVICDPPYGFNTIEEDQGLADLYSDFLDKAIASLKPYGQLVLCVPAESYTGRDLPFCTQRDIISRQIILKAKSQKRLIYNPAKSVPNKSLSAPYYWEADKALRRSILHFYFV